MNVSRNLLILKMNKNVLKNQYSYFEAALRMGLNQKIISLNKYLE